MSFLIASDNGPSPAYLRAVTGEPRARAAIITEFRDARVFPTAGEAAEAHRKWCEVLRDANPDNDQWPKIVPVTHIPATPEFAAAIMLSSDNIPAEGEEVKLIWRNGETCGVVSGFLRREMLRGRFMRDPDFCRYAPLSYPPKQAPSLSISDDDVCSTCAFLDYRPGELSTCRKLDAVNTWPAVFDADGSAVSCAELQPKPN